MARNLKFTLNIYFETWYSRGEAIPSVFILKVRKMRFRKIYDLPKVYSQLEIKPLIPTIQPLRGFRFLKKVTLLH